MATTMISPTSAPRPSPGPEAVRFVAVRANLLPDEVLSARQVLVVRKQVLLGLVVVAALLVAAYAASWWQTSSARSNLDDAQRQGVAYQNQQNEFAGLVAVQGKVQSIQTQLRTLMVGDLSWKGMLTTLRAKAPSGVSITTVTGNINAAAITAAVPGAAAAALNQSGKPSVGQLTITGTAPDKKTTAAYADKLGSVKGLTAPLISSITSSASAVTFTVTVVITSDALGGRYSAAAPATTTTGGH
jgi:Tfp pilus assembly protein PilN